jgi:hypothetical protein
MGSVDRHILIAKTAQRTGVSEHTAADVLKAAEAVEGEDSYSDSPLVTGSIGRNDAALPVSGESVEIVERRQPSDASNQAARRKALEKAEEAFGKSDSSKRSYSERSGLLA